MTFGSAVSNSCRRRVLLVDTSRGRARAIARFSEYPMCLNAAPRSSEVRALGVKCSGGTAHPKGVCHGQTLLATLDECHDQSLCTITERNRTLILHFFGVGHWHGGRCKIDNHFFFWKNLLSTNLHIFIISSEKFCVAKFSPEFGHTKISLLRQDECVYQRCIYYHDSWIILIKTALES